jgi:assimilatory nitrate reductase catalytic subunit
MAHQREPLLDVHPADAARVHLVDGALARVESPHGATVLPVRVSNDQRPGEVFASMHWTDRFAPPDRSMQSSAQRRIPFGQPELKATAVRIAPVAAQWWGLLLRGSEHVPHGPYYWARLPLERGHAFTLIGWEALPNGRGTELWITALLDAPPGAELVFYTDPGRGTFRFASVVGSRLDACVFLASEQSGLPSRDAVAALLGTKIEPEMRTLLLAGNPDGPCAARSLVGPSAPALASA